MEKTKTKKNKAGNGDEVSMSCRVTRGHSRVTAVDTGSTWCQLGFFA